MKKNALSLTISMLAIGLGSSLSVQASNSANSLTEALTGGDASVALRYRAEYVDQDGPTREAKASTLKSRITYKTLTFEGFSSTFEMDNTSVVFDDNYNDGTGGEEAKVVDPTYTEINQAYLNYVAGDTNIRYGRQRINLNNQRFIGGVGWRQNEQTYDAFSIVNTSLPDTTITLANIYNINQITGGNIDGNDHQIYHVLNESIKGLKASAYYYDLKDISSTAGLRLTGSASLDDNLSVLYTAEFAEQTTDTAIEYDTNYMNLEAGITLEGITAKLAYELQSSDKGNAAFTTPLGTNHSFNGWADMFLSTPNTGLVDSAITLSSAKLGPKIALTYHQFDSDVNNIEFGNEIDLAISKKFTDNYSGLFKVAQFDGKAEGGIPDTTKVWLQLEAKF
tara:strand:- start:16516 stop:17697 length:1182 start_codon:yes stop_codon:yes gene_type:complete